MMSRAAGVALGLALLAGCVPAPADPYYGYGYGYGYGYAAPVAAPAPAPYPYYGGGYAPYYAPGAAVIIGSEGYRDDRYRGDRYRGPGPYDRGRPPYAGGQARPGPPPQAARQPNVLPGGRRVEGNSIIINGH